jgi:hypothetical protein
MQPKQNLNASKDFSKWHGSVIAMVRSFDHCCDLDIFGPGRQLLSKLYVKSG